MPSNAPFMLGAAIRNVELDIIGRIQVVAKEGVSSAGNGVQALAAAFGSNIGNRADLTRAHKQVAAEMREAVVTAYEDRVEAHRKDYGARQNTPARLSGVLRKALESEALIDGTARGINFIDTEVLGKEAKHYARLNFGTRGPGEGGLPARAYPVSLFGSVLFSVGLRWGPSPAFYLPKGLFLGGNSRWYNPQAERRGLDVFYPLGELPGKYLRQRANKLPGYDADHPAKAIQARRFLDAGLAVMGEELPAAYDRLVQGWFERNTKAGRVYLEHLTLRGGRVPKNLRTSKQVRVTP